MLVIADPADPFGRYYAEILRAEGLNEFDVADIGSLSEQSLAAHRVVVLARTTLDPAQAGLLTSWVQAGGNLIAMRPDAQLAGLLGLSSDTGDLSNGYLQVAPGRGITDQTMQFHDTADRWTVAGATTVATLYSTAANATSNPAVTLRSVGAAGGQAAAFTFDLARSVVYTRQGNPAWAGQERDFALDQLTRSDDLFFGAKPGDMQPDWIDFDKVAIPQADEQQRLLANLVTQMSTDTMPLPRFWYLPRGEQAAVVMTGDDHAHGGTVGQFNRFKAASAENCDVEVWQCIRATSYVYPGTPITAAQANGFQADGFEIALHLDTGCSGSKAELAAAWTQLADFQAAWPSLATPVSNRNHCIAWSGWADTPKSELAHDVRLDTNYYYWPGGWVNDRPGMFTGSGMPMRFADTDGSLIDVYQATTQLTDESDINIPAHIVALLDGALGPQGFYGVFTTNMHTDAPQHDGADAIVAAAKDRGVPVVSATQMLDWLDGRNDSSFGNVGFSSNRLTFSIERGAGARGLEAMLPVAGPTGELSRVTRGGTEIATSPRTVRGVEYAVHDAAAGDYVATYGAVPVDPPPTPDTTITDFEVTANTARAGFTSDLAGVRFECRLDGAAYGACTSPERFTGLDAGQHTVRVRAVHATRGADPTPAERLFAIAPPSPPDTTITDFAVSGSTGRAEFASDVTGATFQCAIDNVAFSACDSPAQFPGLAAGQHTVHVRAVHATRGADPTPAERLFTIAPPSIGDPSGAGGPATGGPTPPAGGLLGAPTAHRIRVRPRSYRISRSGGVTLGVTCPATELSCRVLLRLRLDGRTVATRTLRVTGGTTRSIRLQLSHSARRRLDRYSSLRVTAASTARDAADNQSTARMAVRLLAPRRR